MLKQKGLALAMLIAMLLVFTGCVGESNVVAVIDDIEITREDLDREIALRYKVLGQQTLPDEFKSDFLDQLIEEELLYREAVNQGLEPDKEDVEQRYDMLVDRLINQVYETEANFIRKLEEHELTQSDFKEVMERITTIEMLRSEKEKELEMVTKEEIEEFYDDNKESFKEGDKRHIKHILVDSQGQADTIRKRITDRDEDFDELAKEFSDCPSGEDGGDLGVIGSEGLDEGFADAAFSIEVGTLSEPVESSFGWHIIKVLDEEKGYTRELDAEVKNQITNHIMQQRAEEAETEFINSLKKEVNVENRLND
ncbi:peptidylprolyl isomerase [Proteinivorax tanatarense]|uniref:Peptidylprolyl isomerase n=1 Tax=Proteinivorax tanatarense TaxID=1260629 RepID=A0AAU7VLQ3_9FIRM